MNPSKNLLLFVVFVIGLSVLATSFGVADAHETTPITASPAAGEVLAQSPAEVRLTFEEEISEEGSFLQVFDDQGKQVDRGNGGVDLNDAQHASLVADLPVLSEGVYQVKWQVTLLDGDVSQGKYNFGVGNVTIHADTPELKENPGLPVITLVGMGAALILIVAIGVYMGRKARWTK